MAGLLESTVDGARILVDTSAFDDVTASRPLALVAAAVVVGVAVVVAGAARPGTRAATALALPGAGIGAGMAFAFATVRDVQLAWLVDGLAAVLRRGDDIAVVGGAAAGGALVLAVAAIATGRRRAFGAGVSGVAVAAGLVGLLAVVQVGAIRVAAAEPLRAAWPVPAFAFAGQDPEQGPPLEVHPGRTRREVPSSTRQLGSTLPTTPTMEARWGLASLRASLRGERPGEAVARAQAISGPVIVEVPVRFTVVEDVGPAGIHLTPGHRQAFVAVEGRDGVVVARERALQKIRRGDKAPSPDVVMRVLDEREELGQRVLRVQISRRGSGDEVIDVVARDGAVYRFWPGGGGALLVGPGPQGGCVVPLLGYRDCRCTSRGIERCVQTETNTLGALGRMSLAILTLGLSEVTGACPDCGRAYEKGLVLLP
jgi:hypothetical protein